MEQQQLIIDAVTPSLERDERTYDWCAYCFAPAEEGPIVRGRRYCSGAHAKRDAARRDEA